MLCLAATGGARDAGAQALTLVPTATGNEARYRVREQLARLSFPSDAVGRTTAVTGAIVFAADGSIDRERSRFVIDLTTLATDNQRRDGYVRRNTLVTDSFPTITLVPAAIRNLPWPLPPSGEGTFQLTGDLTLKGVTRPSTWHLFLQFSDTVVAGVASTRLTFADHNMTVPRVAMVLSVEDDIRLEYEFRLVKQ